MLDLALVMMSGIFVGMASGLLPGINVTIVLILSSSFLVQLDIIHIVIFYVAVLASSQYMGSITALVLGVPGESNSLPAVILRKNFITDQQIVQSIYNTAAGSIIGAVVSLMLSIPILLYFSENTFYMRTIVTTIVGIAALLFSIYSSDNRWYISVLLITIGWISARVGYNYTAMENFLTFNNPYLMNGIPDICFILGLFVWPNLIAYLKKSKDLKMISLNTKVKVEYSKDLMMPSIRGSAIGFSLGIVPYIGGYICTTVAWMIEKRILPASPLAQITSAETSNNSAYVSMLIPMFIFGIAITPSEAVFLDILYRKGVDFRWTTISDLMQVLLLSFLVINMICFILSYNLINLTVAIFNKIRSFLFPIVCVIMIASVWQMGSQVNQSFYYLAALAFFSFVGSFLTKVDTLPLVFSFILQSVMERSIINTWSLLNIQL